jgi:hypothetical protein
LAAQLRLQLVVFKGKVLAAMDIKVILLVVQPVLAVVVELIHQDTP